MAAQYDSYAGAPGSTDTTAYPSARLWSQMDAYERDGRAYGVYEDFKYWRTGTPGATIVEQWNPGWQAVGVATNGTFAVVDAVGGGVTFSTEVADNDHLTARMYWMPFQIIRTGQPLVFECRMKVASIADTKSDVFIGLGDAMTISATVPITATAGDLATENLVGFHRDATDGDEINAVCCSADATHTVIKNGLATLVADTYVKLGFMWNPLSNDFNLRFFVNGVENATTHVVSATAGDVFPNDVRMGLIISQQAVAASAGLGTFSWVKCYQKRAD